MTSCSFIILSYLSFILHVSKGSDVKVTQPQTVMVNPDRSVSITCEHTADPSTLKDVRLNAVLPGQNPQQKCQDKVPCKNIVMYKENPNRVVFVMFNIGQEEMIPEYQCQITVDINYLHTDISGAELTTLVEGQEEAKCEPTPQPQTEQWTLLEFILIGFLAVTLLYSFVITCYFLSQKVNRSDDNPENSVYVHMRKAPVRMNPEYDMSCG